MRDIEPVLIIGAGPTGLSAALALGLAGIPAIVLEADPQIPHDLRDPPRAAGRAARPAADPIRAKAHLMQTSRIASLREAAAIT